MQCDPTERATELAVFVALGLGMTFLGPQRSHASQVDRIQVIDASRDDGTSERRNIGRPFDETNRCSERRRVAKIADLLGADVTAVLTVASATAIFSIRSFRSELSDQVRGGSRSTAADRRSC